MLASAAIVAREPAERAALAEMGVEIRPGPFLDFLEPRGNRVEIVSYRNPRLTKAPKVPHGMGLDARARKRAHSLRSGR